MLLFFGHCSVGTSFVFYFKYMNDCFMSSRFFWTRLCRVFLPLDVSILLNWFEEGFVLSF